MNGNRRQTARVQQESRKSGFFYWFIMIFELLIIFALFFALRINDNKLKTYTDAEKVEVATDSKTDMTKSMDSMGRVYTNDGTPIDLYVITDPDRGTEFVVGSRGGVCVRP